MKKKTFGLLALSIAMAGSVCVAAQIKHAPAQAAGEQSLIVDFNGGFGFNGRAYVTDPISYNFSGDSVVLTKDNAKAMLGGYEYVYEKGTAGTYDGVTVNENGTWSPVSDKELPTGMLYGFFYDENNNGVADETETIYRRGDELPLKNGATLKCYYEQKYVFTKVHMKNEVMLKRATKDLSDNLNAFQSVYTESDFTPICTDMVIVGPNAFTYNYQTGKNNNNITTSVALPETVTQIRDEAFIMCVKLVEITGFQNVELVGARAFILCGQNANQSETMFLEFGDKLKALGNLKAVENIGGANNRGTVFAVNRSNVRIIFNEPATETSPLQTPIANVEQFQAPSVDNFFVYVPKGTSDAWYPTDNYVRRMTALSANKVVGMREMVRINYDLNGGTVNGKTAVGTQYLDYGAAEVTRDGAEVNILDYNPKAQDLSKLNTVKYITPVNGGTAFKGWKDQNGKVWTESMLTSAEELTTITEDLTLTAVWDDDKLLGSSITLDGNIGLNFYLKVTDAALADENAKAVVYTADGVVSETKVSKLTDETKEGANKKLTVFVSAKDYKTVYNVKLVYGEREVELGNQSVENYQNTILNGDYDENLKTLVTAMKNYNSQAEKYFADEEATADVDETVTAETLKNYAATVTGDKTEGIEIKKISLILKGDTAIRIYFTATDTSLLSGTEYKKANSDNENTYYVEITNIKAFNLDATYKATIGTQTVSVSVMSAAYAVLSSDTASLAYKNLVKTIYAYSLAANAYFESQV